MKYSEFIHNTLSNQNSIRWNYYQAPMNTDSILDAEKASGFIKEYFQNGEKNLPLLLDPSEAEEFIHRYFDAGNKKLALAFQYDALHQLPPERATHTVSGFFLGLLIENCINGVNTLAVESQNNFPFSYLWFLTYLYHDYGYCIAERRDLPNPFPRHAPIPEIPQATPTKIPMQEYQALIQIKRTLGISLSPFSQHRYFSQAGRYTIDSSRRREHEILYTLTCKKNRLIGSPYLRLNNDATIRRPRYSSAIITRYLNYCINNRGRTDHGIIGGLLFYDRMLKNYMLAYVAQSNGSAHMLGLEDFYYQGRHFCMEQLKIFAYISDCILSHNVFRQPPEARASYETYLLDSLYLENFQSISYDENPLLYILSVTDSLDPVKVYSRGNTPLGTNQIIEAINIEYTPGSRVLSFSSQSSDVDIAILYDKAKDLEAWTSARCSALENNRFELTL